MLSRCKAQSVTQINYDIGTFGTIDFSSHGPLEQGTFEVLVFVARDNRSNGSLEQWTFEVLLLLVKGILCRYID